MKMKIIFFKMFLFTIIISVSGFATAADVIKPSAQDEQTINNVNDGINFQEWESDFNASMTSAKVKVKKCEAKSKNCQFEKFQALDPSFDMVH
jgi:hypothetical protein